MAVGKLLHLRLFIEGLEVPVISAQVSINTNAPATAAIQIIPIDAGMKFHPRTMVHLFFLEKAFSIGDFGSREEASKALTAVGSDVLKNYKLLFTGEIIGFSFVQTPASRGLILQCLDFSSYWDAAHATAIEYGPAGNLFSNQASLYGSNAAHFDDIVSQQAEKLTQWIKSKPRTPGLETVSGLAGGIIHMLEAIGGVPKHSKGINDFFTVAELRCRILQQIVAEENDQTAYNLLKVKVFDEWLRSGLQNIGQQVTFRDMMKLLFQYIYYEAVPNPAAKYDPDYTQTSKKKTTSSTSPLNTHPVVLQVRASLSKIIEDLLGGFGGLGGLGPESDIKRAAVRQNTIDIDALMKMLKPISNTAPAVNDMLKAKVGLDAFWSRPKNQPPGNYTIPGAVELLNRAIDYLTNTDKPTKTTSITKEKVTAKLARLRSHIIRPDCWFVSPPKCNVIFPEQFAQLAYDRMFIQEVTRTLVLTYNTLVGKDTQLPQLADNRVLAPNIGTNPKSLTQKAGKQSYRVLMDHELHTGIVPRSEWIPNTATGSAKTSDEEKAKYPKYRLNWAEKIALFHFFKYRFGPRQANVSGRFNPYIVCGFPAAVVTRPFIIPGISQSENAIQGDIIEYVAAQAKKYDPPAQLVGMVAAVSHNIDQGGGQTTVAMHHVRRHSGIDDEFLNILITDKLFNQKKRVKVVLKADEVRSDIKLLSVLASVTPQSTNPQKARVTKFSPKQKNVKVPKTTVGKNGKKTTTYVDKVISYRLEDAKNVDSQQFVTKGNIEKVDKENVLIPKPPGKLTTGSQGVYGKIIGIEVLDPTLVIIPELKNSQAYTTVMLYEEVDVPAMATRPLEEILRPTFFSPKYSNSQIGKDIYQPFFGCQAIVDDITGGATPPPAEQNDGTTVEPKTKIEDLLKEFGDEAGAKAKVSVEKAINFISYVYGVVKAQGKDVDEFITQYNYRPIASLLDMLGSADLEYSISGTDVKVSQGTYGFHTGAVDSKLIDAGPLVGLVEDPSTQLKRIDGSGKESPVPPQYDIRKAKKERVVAYIEALKRGTGIIG